MHRGLVIPLGVESRLCGILFSQMETSLCRERLYDSPHTFSQMNNSVGYTKYLYAKTRGSRLTHRHFYKTYSSPHQSY